MSILSVIKEACPVLGIPTPNAVIGSIEPYAAELAALANNVAQGIAFDGHDWTRLKKLATIAGDGISTEFALPPDYQRMLKKAQLWPSYSPFAPLTHYPDVDQWLGLTVQNYQCLNGAWTIIGDKMNIRPVPPTGATIRFPYLSNLIVKGPGANPEAKATFTDNGDTFLLDERLLKLGVIWQWKQLKGQSYGEEMASYEDAMASICGADRGSNMIVTGARRHLCFGME